MIKDLLRKIPSVDSLLKDLEAEEPEGTLSSNLKAELLREILEENRKAILAEKLKVFSKEDIINTYYKRERTLAKRNLRRVINCTGIILHTNLGRAVLSHAAQKAVAEVSGNYTNLEYNLQLGERGSRYTYVEELVKRITGAEEALIVNNNAAAIMLVLNTLCKGKEAIVSRGQLVEIGGSFRIPEVMEFSGAKLIEVGTTNKTHLYDYEKAINEATGIILKVHTSNYKIIGFSETVESEKLVELGKARAIPVVEDVGSGVLIDFSKYGLEYEPTVQNSIKNGVDVVTFSGDKILGGPQCGIIAGKKQYIQAMKKNQLLRALRVDELCVAALEATLLHYLKEASAVEEIPTLKMLLSPAELHRERAERLRNKLEAENSNLCIQLKKDFSIVGGGARPEEKIESYVLRIKHRVYKTSKVERHLRSHETPIIVRIDKDEIIMDLRTIPDKDLESIIKAFSTIEEKVT